MTLRDDCFAYQTDRITAEQAWARLRESLSAMVRTETIALARASGRILATDVVAVRDLPNADNSAVDGYAVRHADLRGDAETRLRVTARIAAGELCEVRLAAGESARIFTGAMMPAGADTVIMQEDAREAGGEVLIPPGIKPGANRRRAGEDVRAGQVALSKGRHLQPQHLAMLAALGCARVKAWRKLRVALISTGDELREAGEELPHGAAHDANRPMLRALLDAMGVRVSDLGIVRDSAERVRDSLLRAAQTHDVILTSGGASVGDADHVVSAVRALGQLHFWSIAVKPGRPLAFGQVDKSVFIGLPGNPVAALVCFALFVRPVLRLLGGGVWSEPRRFFPRADFDFTKKAGRREWLRGSLASGPAGELVARRFSRQGSGILTSLTHSDGLIELGEDLTQVWRGERVGFIPFSELGIG